jgi:hypothetical protein
MVSSEKLAIRCPSCGVVGRGFQRHLDSDLTCPKCKNIVRFVKVDSPQSNVPKDIRLEAPSLAQSPVKIEVQPNFTAASDASKKPSHPAEESVRQSWFFKEPVLIAITLQQLVKKFWDLAASKRRLRVLRKQEFEAKTKLGMNLIQSGQGDTELLALITSLKQRMESINAAKGSTKNLQVELKGLAIRLCESVLNNPPRESDEQITSCKAIIQSRVDQQNLVSKLSSQVTPSDPIQRRRAAIGSGISLLGLFALVCIALLLRSGVMEGEPISKLITDAGFEDNTNPLSSLEDYVRFGSKTAATKWARGDSEDRDNIKKDSGPHRNALRNKKLRLDGLKFSEIDRDKLETKGLIADLDLPMRVRGDKPFYEDSNSFSGSLLMMSPSEIDHSSPAFLTKSGTLRPCSVDEAFRVRRTGGVLYFPERGPTTLKLIFSDNPDALKEISQNIKDYTISIEFTELSWERTLGWGYFQGDAWHEADWDCQKMWCKQYLDEGNSQPSYFPLALGTEPDDQAIIPEILRAKIISLQVVDKAGKVMGGYNL